MHIDRINNKGQKSTFVLVTENEALGIIGSLSHQLMRRDPNNNRKESYTDKGEYFSIAVEFKSLPEMVVNNLKEMERWSDKYITKAKKILSEGGLDGDKIMGMSSYERNKRSWQEACKNHS